MLLDLTSDLHLDHDKEADEAFIRDYKKNEGATVCVVAGDLYSISNPVKIGAYLKLMATMYEDVIFVPGNHDYWKDTPESFEEKLRLELAGEFKIHVFFTPHYETIQDWHFLGGTMFYRKPHKRMAQDFIDFRLTQAPREWFFKQQRDLEAWLYDDSEDDGTEGCIVVPDLQDTIVITHHLPTPHSTPPQFKGSPTDHFFMCNMTGAIMDRKPKLWCHGHTHESCDYTVDKTRVVCHPRGYPHEIRTRGPYGPKLIEVCKPSQSEPEEK
jgi:predicted phosphodiesterase